MGKIVALIPARSGSKRVPNKNFKRISGLQLIEYSIITACACPVIDYVVVSSDGCPWVEQKYDVVYLDRPAELCLDDTIDYFVIEHALNELMGDIELIVYLRPTTPYRALYHIEQAIKTIKEAGDNATGLRSVELMGESAYKCFERSEGYLAPIMPADDPEPQQDLPNQLCTPTYKANGYVDIAKAEVIRTNRLWGGDVIGYVTPHTVEIDTLEDLEYAQWWIERQKQQEVQMRLGKENF